MPPSGGGPPTAYDEQYQYDQVGNFVSKAGVSYAGYGNGAGNSGHAHAAALVNSQPYAYDANGNLTSGGGRSLVWNTENQPTSITGPDNVTETYLYTADGTRVARTRVGLTTVYAGPWEEDFQSGSSKETRAFLSLQGRMIAQRARTTAPATDTTIYLHGDHLGSVSVATSSTGAVLSKQGFTPWGEVRPNGYIAQTTLNYTGQKLDGTGLLFYHARYYDPKLGRFASADSIVPGVATGQGGQMTTLGYDQTVTMSNLTVDVHENNFVAAVAQENARIITNGFWYQQSQTSPQWQWGPRNPQSLNRYCFVLNNPLRYTDPTGHAENGSYVLNNSSVAIVIRGERKHEERYRRPGCIDNEDNPNNCFYAEEVLVPGQSSAELDFVDVDSVRAVDGHTLERRGPEWEFKLYAFSFVEIRDSAWGDQFIYTHFCLLQVTCGKWVPTGTEQVPNPPVLPPSCDSGDFRCNEYAVRPLGQKRLLWPSRVS